MVEFSPFFGIILVTAPMLPDTRLDDDERKSDSVSQQLTKYK